MDTNSWIYNKHKILFELQSMFHPCINQKPQDWLPPYKNENICKNSIYKRVYIMLTKNCTKPLTSNEINNSRQSKNKKIISISLPTIHLDYAYNNITQGMQIEFFILDLAAILNLKSAIIIHFQSHFFHISPYYPKTKSLFLDTPSTAYLSKLSKDNCQQKYGSVSIRPSHPHLNYSQQIVGCLVISIVTATV